MKWRWCYMCRFDGHCENQDRNMECACYAREQTLRAEQYSNLIDKVETENTKLKELLKECKDEINPYQEVTSGKKTFRNLIAKINQTLGEDK